MVMFVFFLGRKYPFLENLFQKIKIVCLSWNLVYSQIQICCIRWWCSLSLSLFDKFVPKIQNCLFKVQFGVQTILNILNSMVMTTFLALVYKCHFGANLVENIKIVCISWNLAFKSNLSLQNSMVMFTLCFKGNPVLGKVCPKFKIACLS